MSEREQIINRAAAQIGKRFPKIEPPKKIDAQQHDNLGRPVHYPKEGRAGHGALKGSGSSADVMLVSDAGTRRTGGRRVGKSIYHGHGETARGWLPYEEMTDAEFAACQAAKQEEIDARNALEAAETQARLGALRAWSHYRAARSLWRAQGRKGSEPSPPDVREPKARAAQRSFSTTPIILKDVDPFGRPIRCNSTKQARAEAERHGCYIEKGGGE